MAPQSLADNGAFVFKGLNFNEKRAVTPGGAQRRPGIHSGALSVEVQAWIPGLPAVARDDARLGAKFQLTEILGFMIGQAPQDEGYERFRTASEYCRAG